MARDRVMRQMGLNVKPVKEAVLFPKKKNQKDFC
jgi:hypothetical protein